jgi:ribosomal protein L29
MKMKELKLKTDAELSTLLAELKTAVASANFSRVFQNKKDTTAGSKAKKTIARILTLRKEKQVPAKNA